MKALLCSLALLGAVYLGGCTGDDAASGGAADADTLAANEADAVPDAWTSERMVAEGFDPYGFFLPQARVVQGPYVFDHLFLGAPSDFAAYESGEREEAPVWVEIVDTTSALVETEIGMVHQGSYRVWAETFRVTPEEVRFRGTHERFGEVQFTGRLDAAALESAQDAGPNAFGPNVEVLTGDLLLGGTVTRGLGLYWYGGD